MAAAAAKNVTPLPSEPAPPDVTKPIRYRYWKVPEGTIGQSITPSVTVGQGLQTGAGVEGVVQEITGYPTGHVVARLKRPSTGELSDIVFFGGHGVPL